MGSVVPVAGIIAKVKWIGGTSLDCFLFRGVKKKRVCLGGWKQGTKGVSCYLRQILCFSVILRELHL